MKLSWQQAMGIDQSHLIEMVDDRNGVHLIHSAVAEPLKQLLNKAESDAVEITIVSGFRNFERQLSIWNEKWLGHKPVFSRHGRPLNLLSMSNIEKFKAISLWSALPGLSRHHWGTDFDIFLTKPIKQGYQVELTPEEFSSGGPCAELESWLQNHLTDAGFFRPYRQYQQGVSNEPWHISHISTSTDIFTNFDKASCRRYLENSTIKAAPFVMEQFDHYYQQYFCNLCDISQ